MAISQGQERLLTGDVLWFPVCLLCAHDSTTSLLHGNGGGHSAVLCSINPVIYYSSMLHVLVQTGRELEESGDEWHDWIFYRDLLLPDHAVVDAWDEIRYAIWRNRFCYNMVIFHLPSRALQLLPLSLLPIWAQRRICPRTKALQKCRELLESFPLFRCQFLHLSLFMLQNVLRRRRPLYLLHVPLFP